MQFFRKSLSDRLQYWYLTELVISIGACFAGNWLYSYLQGNVWTPIQWLYSYLQGNVSTPIQKVKPSILTDDFSSRIDSSIFTLITPVLLDQSNKTSWVFPALKSRSHFLSQSTVSCRWDSNSEANSSCRHRSDAWSNIEERVVSSA